jgi:hypothetical protein
MESPDAQMIDSGPVFAHGEIGIYIDPDKGRALMNAVFLRGPNRDVALDSAEGCMLYGWPLGELVGAGTVTLNLNGVDHAVNWVTGGYEVVWVDLSPAPGAVVSGMAAGDEVAAFSGTATMPPTLLGVDLPPEGANVSKSSPFTISWSPGTSGETIHIGLSPDGPQRYLSCEVPDDLGEFTIPAELMAQMPEVGTWIAISRIRKTRVEEPSLDVHVVAVSYWNVNVFLVP